MYQVQGIPLDLPFPLSAETARTQRELKSSLDAHNKACAEVDAQANALRQTGATDWTPDRDADAQRLGARKRELLVSAIAIRELAESWLATVLTTDKPAAVETSYRAYETAAERVKGQLLALGFVDDPNRPESLVSELAAVHPAVKAARVLNQDFEAYDNRPNRRVNDAELAKLKTELAEYRERAVAGI